MGFTKLQVTHLFPLNLCVRPAIKEAGYETCPSATQTTNVQGKKQTRATTTTLHSRQASPNSNSMFP